MIARLILALMLTELISPLILVVSVSCLVKKIAYNLLNSPCFMCTIGLAILPCSRIVKINSPGSRLCSNVPSLQVNAKQREERKEGIDHQNHVEDLRKMKTFVSINPTIL